MDPQRPSLVVYTIQISLIFILIIGAIVNISINNKTDLWIPVLGTLVGYLLPNPKLKIKQTNESSGN